MYGHSEPFSERSEALIYYKESTNDDWTSFRTKDKNKTNDFKISQLWGPKYNNKDSKNIIIGLSSFEVNGRYLGKEEQVLEFDLSYLGKWAKSNSIHVQKNKNGLYQIQIMDNISPDDKKKHLLIGNIRLQDTQSDLNIGTLFGLAEKSMVLDYYNQDRFSLPRVFTDSYVVVMHDNDGNILDHHEHGIEMLSLASHLQHRPVIESNNNTFSQKTNLNLAIFLHERISLAFNANISFEEIVNKDTVDRMSWMQFLSQN